MLQASNVHGLPSLQAALLGVLEQYPEMHSSTVQSMPSEHSVWFWHCVGEDDGAKLVVGDTEGLELGTDEGLSELIVGESLGAEDGDTEGSSELIVGEVLGSEDGEAEGEVLGTEDGPTDGRPLGLSVGAEHVRCSKRNRAVGVGLWLLLFVVFE